MGEVDTAAAGTAAAGTAVEAGTTTADTWAGTSIGVGRFRVARNLRLGPIRSRLGRAWVCRPGWGRAGLAPRLGLERFWLGRGRLGVGWPAGRCFIRRDRRSSADRRAAADLRSAAADRRRSSGDRPDARRGSPASTCGGPSRSGGPTATHQRIARRGAAAADRHPAAACHRRCSGAPAARHLCAARLCTVYRSSSAGLCDHRARLVAWRLHHRRLRNHWSDGGNITFRSSGVRRRTCRLSWSTATPIPLGLGRGLARRMARSELWRRLARRRLRRLARRRGRLARSTDGRGRLRRVARPRALS